MTAAAPRKASPAVSVAIMLAASTLFAANHVSARIAFDHGASVATGVFVRALCTAVVLLALIHFQKVKMAVPAPLLRNAVVAGVFIAAQSYCLYSAVALLPVGLALLFFHTSPLLYVLFAWAMGKESPRLGALAAIAIALAGLALALNTTPATFAGRWAELGPGILWALAGAVCFVGVLYMNAHSLKGMDRRLSTLVMTAVTAGIVLACTAPLGLLKLPADGWGWAGLGLLSFFYGAAMCTLFLSIPRVVSIAMIALNFEAIAALALGFVFLGQAVAPIQVLGAFMTVGAIAWVGAAKA